jgi:hypothetical protein
MAIAIAPSRIKAGNQRWGYDFTYCGSGSQDLLDL